jgi:ribosomal protein S18 acetylase RimI-like enzyme
MPSEITFRAAEAGDARLIATLATVTFFEAYFEQDDPPDLANYLIENFSPEVISEDLADPDSFFFIMYRGGKTVGYAKLRDKEPHPSVTSRNAIELQRIYLVERVWGSGIGDRLLDHCIEFARSRGKDVLWLGVWEENPRALRFYKKHGFERVGTLEFPYADTVGVNAVMQLELNTSR